MHESAGAANTALEKVRFEIDSIDDEICRLLEKRFAEVEHVRSLKSARGQTSPVRPAREYSILKRLVSRPDRHVAPELKVRLWRLIMSAATLSQAPVTIHVGAAVAQTVAMRLIILEHFGSMPIVIHESDEAALVNAGADKGRLCVVPPGSNWSGPYLAGECNGAVVMGCLPLMNSAASPALLILGHTEPEPTGQDETIVISGPDTIRTGFNWQVASGGNIVTSLPGFHSSAIEVSARPVGIKIAGHYSRLTVGP